MEWSGMKIKWSGMKMKWSELKMGKKERFIFLENIGCQVLLIFTLYFLYKTANQWLVFRLIQFLFFFNRKEQRLGWWRRRILLHQPYWRIILKDFEKFLLWEWLMIDLQSVTIHNERSLILINGFDSYRSINKKNFNLIWPKPMSLKFTFEIFELGIK